jgi:amidase
MTTQFARYFSDAMRTSMNAMRRLRGFTQTWATLMERFDVIMSPSLAEPPAPLGHLATHQPFEVLFERLTTYTPFTAAINAAGAPALTLPLGRSARGLPMGVQFAAAQGQERLLLDLGRELEQAAPWEKMAPRSTWNRS